MDLSIPGLTKGFWINIKPRGVTNGLVSSSLGVFTVQYSVLFLYSRLFHSSAQSNRYFMQIFQWKKKKAHFGRVHIWWSNNWEHVVAKDPKALKTSPTFLSQFYFSTACKPLTAFQLREGLSNFPTQNYRCSTEHKHPDFWQEVARKKTGLSLKSCILDNPQNLWS